jgi:hypothetical protein
VPEAYLDNGPDAELRLANGITLLGKFDGEGSVQNLSHFGLS